MKIDFKALDYFLETILTGFPFYLNGQTGCQDNNYAVQKSPSRFSMDSGKVVYIRRCLPCPQSEGLRDTSLHPPLNNKTFSGDKKGLIEIVIKGAHQNEEIKGRIYENIMPVHPEIKDQKVADVFINIRNSFGN